MKLTILIMKGIEFAALFWSKNICSVLLVTTPRFDTRIVNKRKVMCYIVFSMMLIHVAFGST